jgi:lysophospholipase L1-like esterase
MLGGWVCVGEHLLLEAVGDGAEQAGRTGSVLHQTSLTDRAAGRPDWRRRAPPDAGFPDVKAAGGGFVGKDGGMESVALDSVRVAGALDHDVTGDGVVFRRLPAWTRHEISDIQLALLVTVPAGVRLEFETDATAIELDVKLTLLQINGRPVKPAVFDLVVDAELSSSVGTTEGTRILYDAFTGDVEFQPGEPTTIRFARPSTDGTSPVEVWLPQDCVVELRQLRVSAGATIAAPATSLRRWVHHGSSISHCVEAAQPTATWPAITARLAGVDLQNLAFAGQCMLDQMVARTIRDLPADFISVKAGINIVNGDTMRERTFTAALHGFLDTVRDGHPTTPVVVISPIICPIVEDHPGPTILGRDERFHAAERTDELSVGALTLRRIREIAAEVVASRLNAGDVNLHLISGLDLFGPEDAGDLYDGLHPTADGYRRIGQRFFARAFSSDDAPFGPLLRNDGD